MTRGVPALRVAVRRGRAYDARMDCPKRDRGFTRSKRLCVIALGPLVLFAASVGDFFWRGDSPKLPVLPRAGVEGSTNVPGR
jgi:hypothetical protein